MLYVLSDILSMFSSYISLLFSLSLSGVVSLGSLIIAVYLLDSLISVIGKWLASVHKSASYSDTHRKERGDKK